MLNGVQRFLATQRYPSECGSVRFHDPLTHGPTEYAVEAPQALSIAHRNSESDGAVLRPVDIPFAIDKTCGPSNFSSSVHAWKYSTKEHRKWH
jgi:hypothetical protein